MIAGRIIFLKGWHKNCRIIGGMSFNLKEDSYMNIGSLLTQNALKFPELLAIECEGRSFTYRQFNEEVNKLANGLLQQGVKKGEKLALMMKNSDHFVFTFFAAAKLGAVAVPINFRLTLQKFTTF